MSVDGTKKARGFTFKVRRLVLVAMLLAAVAVDLQIMIHRHAAERRLEELRGGGYPTCLAELTEYTRLPQGVENAAEVYALAFAIFVPPVDEVNVPLLGKATLPDRGTPLPESMVQAISDCVATNRKCLALLHEAGRIAHCRYEWDYADELSPWKTPPHRDALRRCGQLLGLSIILESLNDRAQAVVTYMEDWLHLTESMQKEPGTASYLWRIGSYAAILDRLEWSLNVTSFTDRQLERMGRMLAASATALDLKDALITQRCFAVERFQDMDRSGAPPLKILIRTGELALWAPSIRERGLPDILDYMAACIETADLPCRERTVRFRAIDEALQRRSILHAKARAWAPVVTGSVFKLDLRIHVHFDLARTALAVERFRLASGRMPVRLDELVPGYLEQTPIDPFDGRSIRYLRTELGYILYSVLEDGRDNSGRTREDMPRGEPYDGSFVVMR